MFPTGSIDADVVVRRRPRLVLPDGRETSVDRAMIVGSAPEAAIVIDDRTVSRLHAELEPRSDGLWLKDLGSKNGTFIEDVRIDSGRVPANGAKVRFGAATVTVRYDAPEPVEVSREEHFGPLIGKTPVMRELFARLAKVAPTDAAVLIQGETGTGKELIARAIHDASPRAPHPFIIVDCGALTESLLEAELFGHQKGAFTGAHASRVGAVEEASRGTVFLDEVGELPLAVQPKLLRVLESKSIRRVGEANHRVIDVRFVSATHRDLSRMVNAGAFREDLYFRLAVLTLGVPPLRQRADDIPKLFSHLMRGDAGASSITPAQLARLKSMPWTGNVRELRNFAERVRALGITETFAMMDEALPQAPSAKEGAGETVPPAPPGREPAAEIDLDAQYKDVREAWIDRLEREYFRGLLERHARNINVVAQAAGVDCTYVYRLIRRHGL